MQINNEFLVQLIGELQVIERQNGPEVARYFDDFIKSAKELRDNIYPKPGIMVIPDLECSPQSAQHRGNVNPPLG